MTSNHNSKCLEREPDFDNYIAIMDTTLRDGEQNALCTMYNEEKIKIAKKLEEMNVDIIEAGFAASCGNLETMKQIANVVKKPYLCGLARALNYDVDTTYDAYKKYEKRMIHIFLPTSKEQVEAKLKKSHQELIDIAAGIVRYATKYFPIVEFTAEDAARSDEKFLKKIYMETVRQGANVINVADTVGCSEPDYFGSLVCKVNSWVKEINLKSIVSVHCHNDLGLAFANTLSGIKNKAKQAECTILGIGERAGNCSLEQIVAFSKVHPEVYTTKVNSKELYKAAKLVERFTGVRNPLAPVVGQTAFSHKSGIHQHGVINNRISYEVLNPQDFGRKSKIVVGACSGYHGVIAKAKELGYEINKEEAAQIIENISEILKNKIKKRFSNKDIKEFIQYLNNISYIDKFEKAKISD